MYEQKDSDQRPIDIVIPTRLPAVQLHRLVEQIEATAGYPYTIVYTSTDSSAAANRNLGMSQSHNDRLVMVDDDIEFPANSVGWLRVLAKALVRSEVVMVSAQLFTDNGRFAYMTGLDDCGLKPRREGETVVPSRRLLTACCAFKPHGLRFDENYVGSGFEDIDFCNQLAAVQPDGVFLVCHGAHAIHRNEAKNQRGDFWNHNEAHYLKKWAGFLSSQETA